MNQKKIRPPVKSHGGKHYLAPWIIDHFPVGYENLTFCEPFAGGGSVLLRKNHSCDEIINDLDYNTFAIWTILKYDCDNFVNSLSKIIYNETSFKDALERKTNSIFEAALKEYVLRRMSRGGMKKSFAWSNRLRGGKPGDQNAWETMLTQLHFISERIKNVKIENLDFRKIMENYSRSDVLIYMDPPYLKTTREKNSTKIYDLEMTNIDHIDLCRLCLESPAKIIISGYPSQLYTELLGDWRCLRRGIANHASQAKGKKFKTECLWLNF